MNIGDSVYLISDHKIIGAGVPALICGLHDSTAKVSVEREDGTKVYDVPLWDILPARLYAASILRACFDVSQTLDRQRLSPGTVSKPELVTALIHAGLERKTAEICTQVSCEVDWTAKGPLSAWLKNVRSFYLPAV
jgi:hypothetical protein